MSFDMDNVLCERRFDGTRCLCTVFFYFSNLKIDIEWRERQKLWVSVFLSLYRVESIEYVWSWESGRRAIIDGCYSAHMGGDRTSLYLFCIVHWHPALTAIRFLLNRTHKNEIKFAGLVSHENKDTQSILNEKERQQPLNGRPKAISNIQIHVRASFRFIQFLFLPPMRASAHLLSVRLAYHTIHPK